MTQQASKEPAPAVPARRIDRLGPLPLHANWKQGGIKEQKFLVTGRGQMLELFAESYVAYLFAERLPHLRVGYVPEGSQSPGHTRSLRICNTLKKSHHAAVDVTMSTSGSDLYVGYKAVPHTSITHMKRVLSVALFIALLTLLTGVCLVATNAKSALALEYATKYDRSNPKMKLDEILDGTYMSQGPDGAPIIVQGEPWSWWRLLSENPMLFLMSVGKLPAIFGVVIAFCIAFIPQSAMQHPCRALDWPTPDDFQNHLARTFGWSQRVFNKMAFEVYDVTGDQIHPIQ